MDIEQAMIGVIQVFRITLSPSQCSDQLTISVDCVHNTSTAFRTLIINNKKLSGSKYLYYRLSNMLYNVKMKCRDCKLFSLYFSHVQPQTEDTQDSTNKSHLLTNVIKFLCGGLPRSVQRTPGSISTSTQPNVQEFSAIAKYGGAWRLSLQFEDSDPPLYTHSCYIDHMMLRIKPESGAHMS